MAPVRPPGLPCGSSLQDQHFASAQVRVLRRCGVPDNTATLNLRRDASLVASVHLSGLFDDFDAALIVHGLMDRFGYVRLESVNTK